MRHKKKNNKKFCGLYHKLSFFSPVVLPFLAQESAVVFHDVFKAAVQSPL